MPLHPSFPRDPYPIPGPEVRWSPGETLIAEMGYQRLLPPLAWKVLRGNAFSLLGVFSWQGSGRS